jgi:xanthosine phosphorylase
MADIHTHTHTPHTHNTPPHHTHTHTHNTPHTRTHTHQTIIDYSVLPGFPVSTVEGHQGKLILGRLKGVEVVCLQGRVHLYEGISAQTVRIPIYTLKLIGCEVLFVTSAVGSLRENVGAGELVCLTDHINFQGMNPLVGPNDVMGPRFPSLYQAYDPKLRSVLHKVAKENEVPLHDGVYMACLGPSFETPAEIRAFKVCCHWPSRDHTHTHAHAHTHTQIHTHTHTHTHKILGADVVGMSTVAEVISARHCGLKVVAVSTVVNLAAGLVEEHITHEDTLHYTKLASSKVISLILGFIASNAEW